VKGNPFRDSVAVENSALHWSNNGSLTAGDEFVQTGPFLAEAHETFRRVVLGPGFSCLGAKAAFNDDAYGFAAYAELGSPESTAGLCRDLCRFAQSQLVEQSEYATFIAAFRQPRNLDEEGFEQLLWRQLRQLRDADHVYFDWDQSVSANPQDPHFSFSFAGRAFYVIGMHGGSSRTARTFPWPALVFNPHEQFERLRTDGKWQKMQQAIRAREMVLQGSVNPMLSDFGSKSEARQYSGRPVPDDWEPPGLGGGKCPFH
jgi:FPC/CPF motif-containing protein YcgG